MAPPLQLPISLHQVRLNHSLLRPILTFPVDPQRVFSVSFHASPSGGLRGTQLSHENITAGVTAIRALFPSSGALSPLDTVVSAHSLSTPFGRAVAYTALYEGANFVTVASSKVLNTAECMFLMT